MNQHMKIRRYGGCQYIPLYMSGRLGSTTAPCYDRIGTGKDLFLYQVFWGKPCAEVIYAHRHGTWQSQRKICAPYETRECASANILTYCSCGSASAAVVATVAMTPLLSRNASRNTLEWIEGDCASVTFKECVCVKLMVALGAVIVARRLVEKDWVGWTPPLNGMQLWPSSNT
eukprot:362078-Chlamydomonas_euryale.AAC.7